MPLRAGQLLHPPHHLLEQILQPRQLLQHHIQHEAQLPLQAHLPQPLHRRPAPAPQPRRRPQTVLQQEAPDLHLHPPQLPPHLLAKPHHLAVRFLLLARHLDHPQHPLRCIRRQPAAVQSVALRLPPRRARRLRRRDDVRLQPSTPQRTHQGVARRTRLVHHPRNLLTVPIQAPDQSPRIR